MVQKNLNAASKNCFHGINLPLLTNNNKSGAPTGTPLLLYPKPYRQRVALSGDAL